MAAVALQASSLKKPLFGYITISNDLANKTKYSSLMRVSYTMSYLAEAVRVVLLNHNWTTVSIVKSANANCNLLLSGVAKQFNLYRIIIVKEIEVDFTLQSDMDNALLMLKMTARSMLFVL